MSAPREPGLLQIRLYGPPQAPFVEKVARSLALKKLPFESVVPQGPEDYRRWNPETGLLPVADFGSERVPDSSRILDALDERFPEPPLVSRDPKIASMQRQLEAWAGETFFFYWVNWLRTQVGAEEAPVSAAPHQGPLARLGVLRRIYAAGPVAVRGRSGEEGLGAEFKRRLDDLVSFLGTRPFFHADRISRADITVYAFLRSLIRNDIRGGPALLEERPKLVALMRRVEQETGPPSD